MGRKGIGMNKERRIRLKEIIDNIEKIKGKLRDVLNDEENAFDNMPENLQSSMRGEESQEAIDYMEEAVDILEEVIEQLNSIS